VTIVHRAQKPTSKYLPEPGQTLAMEGRTTIRPERAEAQQQPSAGRTTGEPSGVDGARLGASHSTHAGRAAKWTDWMDRALVRQVLATDPINCGRGRTVAKWAEVAQVLRRLEPQPILRSQESCRQRVKKLVEIYKVSKHAYKTVKWQCLQGIITERGTRFFTEERNQ